MDGAYARFTLIWEGRSIEVSFQANWLNSGYRHIELRCKDRLPVTETGYRSHFVPMAELTDESAFRAFVVDWLDAVASQSAWQRTLKKTANSSSFDAAIVTHDMPPARQAVFYMAEPVAW